MSASVDPQMLMPNCMITSDGDLFYPDDVDEARWFADQHGAAPLYVSVFPFNADGGDER